VQRNAAAVETEDDSLRLNAGDSETHEMG